MAVHSYPSKDKIKHVLSPDCPCDPLVEYIDEETGLPYPRGPFIQHNDLRGRSKEDPIWNIVEVGDYL